jgi:hypothetical protein
MLLQFLTTAARVLYDTLTTGKTRNGVFWYKAHSTLRVAMADFWWTFHSNGKISPCWWGGEDTRPPPFTLFTITYKVAVFAPAERRIHYLCFMSTPTL